MPMPVTSFIKQIIIDMQTQVDKIVKEEMPTIRKSNMTGESMDLVLLSQSIRARVLMDVIDAFNRTLE